MSRDLLRRFPLFGLLSTEQLDGWLSSGLELTVAAGETLFQEGLPGEWAYLVLDGRVRVLRRSERGREVPLGWFGKDEVFGEYALVRPYTCTATCRSTTRTRLLGLPLTPLRRALAGLPGVTPNLKNWLRLHTLLAYLRGQTFLGFLSGPSALAFLDHLRPAAFPAGHTLQADGLSDDCWFFIEAGTVRLEAGGRQRELKPGDWFGERALAGYGGLAVATALSPTRCQVLPADPFARRPSSSVSVSRQSLTPDAPSLARQYVWVGQQEVADCGVAALAMLARSLGLDVSPANIRQLVSLSPLGASLQPLQQGAANLGLHALPVRVSLAQLPQVALPAVAHYCGGHFVVLYELGVKGVVLGDPASGLLRTALDDFARAWSGNLLLVRRSNPG